MGKLVVTKLLLAQILYSCDSFADTDKLNLLSPYSRGFLLMEGIYFTAQIKFAQIKYNKNAYNI